MVHTCHILAGMSSSFIGIVFWGWMFQNPNHFKIALLSSLKIYGPLGDFGGQKQKTGEVKLPPIQINHVSCFVFHNQVIRKTLSGHGEIVPTIKTQRITSNQNGQNFPWCTLNLELCCVFQDEILMKSPWKSALKKCAPVRSMSMKFSSQPQSFSETAPQKPQRCETRKS